MRVERHTRERKVGHVQDVARLVCLASLVVATSGLVACGPVEPTPTAIAVPTVTPLPTATQMPTWDYVALGDSGVSWSGYEGNQTYPFYYAGHVKADLGIEVNLLKRAAAGYTSGDLLDDILNDERWREDLRQAEMVTLSIGFNDATPGLYAYEKRKCGGEDNLDCMRQIYGTLKSNYDAMLDELLALCAPGTIIRVVTLYHGDLIQWGYPNCAPLYRTLNEQIMASAAERNIPVARADVAFNGPEGDLTPDSEYIQPNSIHTTPLGAAMIGDLLRDLGYEATVP